MEISCTIAIFYQLLCTHVIHKYPMTVFWSLQLLQALCMAIKFSSQAYCAMTFIVGPLDHAWVNQKWCLKYFGLSVTYQAVATTSGHCYHFKL